MFPALTHLSQIINVCYSCARRFDLMLLCVLVCVRECVRMFVFEWGEGYMAVLGCVCVCVCMVYSLLLG